MERKCAQCHTPLPTWVKIDGKMRNLCNRKYCLNCSAFGQHNTAQLHRKGVKLTAGYYRCRCGETDPKQFPKRRRFECRRCRNRYSTRYGQERKDKARRYLGGRCMACGFDRWLSALDFHHLDPKQKDENWKTMRGWKWNRVLAELKKMILLCRNCHGALHSGVDVFEDRCLEVTAM